MPDPNDYDADEKQEFISDCISTRQDENPDEDTEQSAAICFSMWDERARAQPIERRAAQLEIRARGRRLEGYAALFNVEARIGDFVESIAPGAFGPLKDDVVALVDHDPTKVLARTRSKTLRLAEDTKGLAFDLDVPDTSFGRDILALAERNDLGGASFGFQALLENWFENKRTLRSVDLREISVVSAWPAYPQTVVTARGKGAPRAPFRRLANARRYLQTVR